MAYRTILVGASGSAASILAVEHAADIAHVTGAQLVLVCAYVPPRAANFDHVADVLKNEAYLVRGSSPTDEILRVAAEKAGARGAKDIVRRAVSGYPDRVLLTVAADTNADLMVIGNSGENTILRRTFGTLADRLKRRARIDVLVASPIAPRSQGAVAKPKKRALLAFRPRLGVQVG